MTTYQQIRIDGERLLAELEELALIGGTAAGGVTRVAFSKEDAAARGWFSQRLAAAGLVVTQDGAGNQSGRLPAAVPEAPTLLIGSHLDTVPNGGRYDGALGTLAALEAARTIRERGIPLPFHLEVINFTDEEGSVLGEFGSQAFTGALTAAQLDRPRGGMQALHEGLARLGLTREGVLTAGRDPQQYCGYLELHIEQGRRLEREGIDIGVVTGIVGIRSFWLTFTGEAAHAGTMPLADRRDALWGAVRFVELARQVVGGRFTPGVVNVGQIEARPGAFNIVPAEVRLALEFRHGSEKQLDEMEAALLGLAGETAARFDLQLAVAPLDQVKAAPAHSGVIAAFETAAERLGLSARRLLSFAGHDTQALSPFTPSGMIFVPSVDGISHNPNEYTKPADCLNGANTLLHAILAYADQLTRLC